MTLTNIPGKVATKVPNQEKRVKFISPATAEKDLEKKSVFVGNLPTGVSEAEIRSELEALFAKYDPIEIKAHVNGEKPFAFIYLKSGKLALDAQKECNGSEIRTRPIRTEVANARSAGFFRRLDGQAIPEEGLVVELKRFGLVRFWLPSESESVYYNLGAGWFVDFGTHEKYKLAEKAFRVSKNFQFDPLRDTPKDLKTRQAAPTAELSSRKIWSSYSKNTGQKDPLRERPLVKAFVYSADPRFVGYHIQLLEDQCKQHFEYYQTDSPHYRGVIFPDFECYHFALQAFPGIVVPKMCMQVEALPSGSIQSPPDLAPLIPQTWQQPLYYGPPSPLFGVPLVPPSMIAQQNIQNHRFDGDAETIVGNPDDRVWLSDVFVGTGVTMIDYGNNTQKVGRLLGHFSAVEHGFPAPFAFFVDDLVVIQDAFGGNHMGYLLGSILRNDALLHYFDATGMPHSTNGVGCPHHGRDCVMGRYLSQTSKQRRDSV